MSDLKIREQNLGVRETRNLAFHSVEMREKANGTGGTVLNFEGYACMTELAYEMADWLGPYTEIVRKGAFAKTLAEGADVAFLLNHEGMTLARTKSETLVLAEDDTGLHVDASLDPANPIVASIRSAMERKDLDEMSFAFRVTRQLWSPDYEQRDILELNIDKGDVSLVNYGANPFTSAGLRSARPLDLSDRQLADALTEVRAGAVSPAAATTLRYLLSLTATTETESDVLADLIDPDATGEEAGTETEAKASNIDFFTAQAAALRLRAAA